MILIEVMLGNQSFYMVSTISFTCLVVIEFLNILTEVEVSLRSCIGLNGHRLSVSPSPSLFTYSSSSL